MAATREHGLVSHPIESVLLIEVHAAGTEGERLQHAALERIG